MKDNSVIETYFDSRLSFKENFQMLEIEDSSNLKIYDETKGLFLNTDIPISQFNISYFMCFQVF